ncbi:hypothetical protein LTR36_007052 [Oleoguttula mirabilis]|uniref:Uncharacterized protein n=1 Tax=Oleoguttula mirabilis TaxID=1507867 RepID=A0AAV9JAP2_9PEZI|nr:hypothetical protein LTR36_007052 [Oleoguttula mirabilis]
MVCEWCGKDPTAPPEESKDEKDGAGRGGGADSGGSSGRRDGGLIGGLRETFVERRERFRGGGKRFL